MRADLRFLEKNKITEFSNNLLTEKVLIKFEKIVQNSHE